MFTYARCIRLLLIGAALSAILSVSCKEKLGNPGPGEKIRISSAVKDGRNESTSNPSDRAILSRSFPVYLDEGRIARRDFKGFSKGAGLADCGVYTFNSKKPKPEELTKKEKGLLVSAALEGLTYNIASYYVETGRIPKNLEDLERYQKLFSGDFLAKASKMTSSELAQTMSYYVSPVSGKVLRFDASSFEPGQAFITIITDKVVLSAYHKKTCQSPEPADDQNKRIAPVYFRVYGERGVIAEEVMEIMIPKVGDPPLVISNNKAMSDGDSPGLGTKDQKPSNTSSSGG